MKNWETAYRAKLETSLHDGPYYFDSGVAGVKLSAGKAGAIELYIALRKELMVPLKQLLITELDNGLGIRRWISLEYGS